jgi:hypothetical protein
MFLNVILYICDRKVEGFGVPDYPNNRALHYLFEKKVSHFLFILLSFFSAKVKR